MYLSTNSPAACLGIALLVLCGLNQPLLADEHADANRPTSTEPLTVAGIVAALDIAALPKPKNSKSIYSDTKMVMYETQGSADNALVAVSDEFLKLGFTAEDSVRTRMATVTVNHQDRPMTIYLMNSLDDSLTHVGMHHHQGIDVSAVPRLSPAGPVDQRVNEVFYTTEIGVRVGQSLLRSQLSDKNLEIARMSSSNGIAKKFVKDGVAFVCHVEDSQSQEFEMPASGDTSATRVHITSRGNFDDLNMQLPDEFEETVQPYNAIFGVRKYYTQLKPIEAVKRAARQLQRVGWKPVDPIRETVSDQQRLLIWNGALVQIGAKGFGRGRTHVDYVVSMLAFDLPPEIETRLVRIDTASSNLFFTTPANVQQVADFYKDHLAATGWEAKADRVTDKPKEYRQLFESDSSATVVLNIRSKGPETTWVEIAPIGSASLDRVVQTDVQAEMELRAGVEATAPAAAKELRAELENEGLAVTPDAIMALAERQLESALDDVPEEQRAIIQQMLKSELGSAIRDQIAGATDSEPDQAVPDQIETSPVDAESEMVRPTGQTAPKGKLAADDFPVPDGAQKVSREFEMITFGVDEVEPNAKSIHQQLVALGWKPRGEQMVESDLAYLKFQKGTGTINATLILDDRRDPPVHVVVQGDGLWFPDPYAFAGETGDFDDQAEMEFEGQEESFDSADDSFTGDADIAAPTEFEGLALPQGIDTKINMSSQFRKETTTSIESDLKSMIEFFRTAASDGNWKTIDEKIASKKATLTLIGERGEMLVNLTQFEGEIEIHLALRDTEMAKKHGFFPKQGRGKLMLANASESKVVIVINGKTYKLDPMQGAEDPSGSIQLNVRPGRYNYTIKGAGREEQSDKLSVVIGGTWAVMVLPEQGHMAEQMY